MNAFIDGYLLVNLSHYHDKAKTAGRRPAVIFDGYRFSAYDTAYYYIAYYKGSKCKKIGEDVSCSSPDCMDFAAFNFSTPLKKMQGKIIFVQARTYYYLRESD